MFGFLRARPCARHTCGVCKTIGAEFGQAPRFLVNHDTVLISELMSGLAGAEPPEPVLVRRHCFSLPDPGGAVSLGYPAAVTVFLAWAKLRDHVQDSGALRWRFLLKAYARPFDRALCRLREWGLPVDPIVRGLESQARRESVATRFDELAEPTVFAAAEVCGTSARLSGRPDAVAAMSDFGRAFGSLAYAVDAWQDYERDQRAGEFNAFRSVFGNRAAGRAVVEECGEVVQRGIERLPLAAAQRASLSSRFQLNLTLAMGEPGARRKLSGCVPDGMAGVCECGGECCCDACFESCGCCDGCCCDCN